MKYKKYLILTLLLFLSITNGDNNIRKRALQKSHEKPQVEKWMDVFFGNLNNFDQTLSLVNLIVSITKNDLRECFPIILYDITVEQSDAIFLEQLFRIYPTAYMHGQITSDYKIKQKKMFENKDNTCFSYIIFMADVMRCKEVIGEQSSNKVIIVARSSQWRVYEFLMSDVARNFVNLLVITQSDKILATTEESPFILYTHRLFIDGIGSSEPQVLTSWINNNFTRNITLFPRKMKDGLSGHRFIVSLAHQPPFVYKKGKDDNDDINWDGTEIRLVNLLSEMFNFTTDYREPKDATQLGSGDAVTNEIRSKRANLGIAGIYTTFDRLKSVDVTFAHSQDCAAFMTLTSTALPRYRAIMGPFHWTVWLAITCIYLFAIFPLALCDKHTLKHLLKKPEEIENMFWYVFGTFTNCFTFTGEASWSNSNKLATRVLIGFYWIFTIITTACYTGSIIAFVTLPIYPSTVDSIAQLLTGRFRIGTLDKGGWQYWFQNSSELATEKLFKSIEYIPNIQSGLRNVTKAFFWPYAFLGSRDELDFVIKTNFTTQSKRTVLHVSNECFVTFGVSLLFPLNSVYKNIINKGLLHTVESGFLIKFKHDFEWDVMRTASGKLLQINSLMPTRIRVDDRALTLDDTQGMFLLLGIGFLLGGGFLISEWLGGCFQFFQQKVRRLSTTSIESNPRSYDTPTPREKINSIQYSVHTRLCSIPDSENENNINHSNHQTYADLILHKEDDNESHNHIDYDKEVDKIFNLEMLFGEKNEIICDTSEQLINE